MNLGDTWQAKIDERNEKEILFNAIDERIKKAMAEGKDSIWFNNGGECGGVFVSEELLKEYAELNTLKVVAIWRNGWYLAPKNVHITMPCEETGLP